MEEHTLLTQGIEWVAQSFSYIGVGFIVLGALIALLQYLDMLVVRRLTMPHVRLTLGTYMLVGLEFMVGQDVVETVIDPGFEHLVGLGSIVVIRTVLEYFLGHEVEHLEHETNEPAPAKEREPSSGGQWWPEQASSHPRAPAPAPSSSPAPQPISRMGTGSSWEPEDGVTTVFEPKDMNRMISKKVPLSEASLLRKEALRRISEAEAPVSPIVSDSRRSTKVLTRRDSNIVAGFGRYASGARA